MQGNDCRFLASVKSIPGWILMFALGLRLPVVHAVLYFTEFDVESAPDLGRVYTRKNPIQVSKFSKGSSPNNSGFDFIRM